MIRSVLELTPRDGNYAALVDFYLERRILEGAITTGGCLHGELHVPRDAHGPAVVSCLWPDAQSYDAWVAGRGGGSPDLIALLDLPDGVVPPGHTYEVAISV